MTSIFARTKTYRDGRVILADDLNDLEDLLVTSFNLLGEKALSPRLGVATAFTVGTATANYHAVTLAQLNAAVSGAATEFVVDTTYAVTPGLNTTLFMQSLTAHRTITLPQNPSDGQLFEVWDMDSAAATYNIVLARNTRNIAGAASDLTIDLNGAKVTLVYDETNTNWAVISVTNIVQQ